MIGFFCAQSDRFYIDLLLQPILVHMLFQVFVQNLLLISLFGFAGYFPMLGFEKKFRQMNLNERLFVAVFMGYFIFESLVGIWTTKGATVQWANFLPFVILPFLADSTSKKTFSGNWPSFTFIPLLVLIFGSWYFVRSYAPDLVNIARYPFIDIVSYASTAFGMQFSGNETAYFDSAIYYPANSPFNLYHFTELWALVGITKLFGVTELYGISFLIPVSLLTMASLGFSVLGRSLKMSFLTLSGLVFVLLFANGKLLFFNDYFLYNVLDLCGLKISLLVPTLIFLYIIRTSNSLMLAFSLWLPQVNILFSLAVGLLWFYYLVQDRANFWKSKPLIFWLLPTLWIFLYVFLLLIHPSESQAFKLQPFQLSGWLIRSFTYFREAIFNLGINYWLPLIILSSIFYSWKNVLLLIPFGLAKLVSRLVLVLYYPALEWSAVYESLIFVAGFWFLPSFTSQKPEKAWLLVGLFILCLVAGAGNYLTGFMDFEQIFTLLAAAGFTVLAFFLFASPSSENGRFSELVQTKIGKWVFLGVCIVFIFKTFRFQRSLPYDKNFYDQISRHIENETKPRFSAYLSSKSYYPFPTHIQAGFPLLFAYSDALSTPISMLDDPNWVGTERESQILNFPLMHFSQKDSLFQMDKNSNSLILRFIKKFGIRYIWLDKNKNSPIREELFHYRKFYIESKSEGLEFWEIDPDKIGY